MENGVTGNTANRTLDIARQRVFGIGPGRWDNGPINLKKKKKRQTDPYGKAMKKLTKKYMFKQNAQYSGLKTNLFQGLKAI